MNAQVTSEWQSSNAHKKNNHQQTKTIFLSGIFLVIIAAYTVVYDLKNSIFISVVGKEYVPYAKMLSMVVLVPAVLCYAFLVDRLRRYQLLAFYATFYGLLGLFFVYLIGHPVIGLLNTDSSPFRMFGWAFYFWVEGFSPFVVSVFWAFINSVNSPSEAKNNYSTLVGGSKIGGALSSGLAWSLLTFQSTYRSYSLSDSLNHQILLLFFSSLSLAIPILIYLFMRKIPGKYLHGYEAAYQFEKKKKEQDEKGEDRPGLWSGLAMLMQKPYILGIFGMVFFYEVLGSILSYQRLGVAQSVSQNVSELSTELYRQMFYMHTIGFFISLIGTRSLLKYFGERVCLMLIPIISGSLLCYFWYEGTADSLLAVFVGLKSVNYAFATPIRESLYIPTVKDIKFKSKSWIDGFGSKLSRFTGSWFNVLTDWLAAVSTVPLHGVIFLTIISGWFFTALLLGNRYEKAIKNDEVIS